MALSGGEGQEGGADGVHAQIAGHLKRDAETSEAVASGSGNGVCRSLGGHGLDGDRDSEANCMPQFLTGESQNTRSDS
jgi:hypothetical protein